MFENIYANQINMTENKFRNTLGIVVVASHFTIILLIIVLRIFENFDDSTLKVALPIVVPLFASYTTLVVRYVIANKTQTADESQRVAPAFMIITSLIIGLFFIFFLIVVIRQAVKPIAVESFAVMLGLGETIFGIYMGYIFKNLYQ